MRAIGRKRRILKPPVAEGDPKEQQDRADPVEDQYDACGSKEIPVEPERIRKEHVFTGKGQAGEHKGQNEADQIDRNGYKERHLLLCRAAFDAKRKEREDNCRKDELQQDGFRAVGCGGIHGDRIGQNQHVRNPKQRSRADRNKGYGMRRKQRTHKGKCIFQKALEFIHIDTSN